MRVLIIEDEEKTTAYLRRGLAEQGYSVDTAANGRDGLHYALELDYDAIIPDLMLPGMNGYKALDNLRRQKATPVIMLSARGAVDDWVRGLRTRADDYMPKPFYFVELVARLQALSRHDRLALHRRLFIEAAAERQAHQYYARHRKNRPNPARGRPAMPGSNCGTAGSGAQRIRYIERTVVQGCCQRLGRASHAHESYLQGWH